MRHTLRLHDGGSYRSKFESTALASGFTPPSYASKGALPPISGITEIDDQPAREYSLAELLDGGRFFGCDDVTFKHIALDAHHCGVGELVLCRIGQDDPNQVIAAAMAGGAAGILTEQLLPCPLPQCIVGSVDRAMASLASAQNNRPDRKLLTIGVLGASGKTSTCLMLSAMTTASGLRTAYQCDLGSHEGVVASTPSTPPPTGSLLVDWLGEAVDCGSRVAVIELDETAARHGEYDSIEFDVLLVTQRDTGDGDFGPSALHATIDRLASSGVVIVNETDRKSQRFLEQQAVHCVTYGTTQSADYAAMPVNQGGGMSTLMLAADETRAMMETPLCGPAMARNLAAASAVGALLGYTPETIAQRLGRLRVIPGRGQRMVEFAKPTAVIETGGAVDRLRASLVAAKEAGVGGRVWCVYAIDGSSDASTLASSGNALERNAHHTVLTTVPEQQEKFLQNAHQILDGVKECASMRLVGDQNKAIEWAMEHAGPRDSVVIVLNTRNTSASQQRGLIEQVESTVQACWEQREELAEESTDEVPAKISLKLFP
ncbi:MAG: Mur ligase family protein [Planctomycetota bacterium]